MNPHQVTRDFEKAVADYCEAPYCVAVNSCTMALLLAVRYHFRNQSWYLYGDPTHNVEIPKRTYVSVPMSIIHANGKPVFEDVYWEGAYQLKPLPIWDSARRFTSGMYRAKRFVCVSFHVSKILGDSQGGAILHDNPEADIWFRKARFDGRTEGVAPIDDTFDTLGYHCYLSPDVAARLLWKLSVLPKHNVDLPNDNYPDLSMMEIFR